MLSELETADVFANSLYLRGLIIFRLISSGIAVLCMLILECHKKNAKFVAHKSLKCLLNLHGFWTFLLCSTTFAESIQQAFVHLTLKSPSDLLQTSNQCFFRMIPSFFGICGSVSSLLVMAIERFPASRNFTNYEHSRGSIKFVALHIMLTILGVFTQSITYGFPNRVAHCTVVSVLGRNVQTIVTAVLFSSELFTIHFYTKLLRQNETMHKSAGAIRMSLSERYQLSENIRVLRFLLPVVISHTSITMAGAVCFFYFELAGYRKELYPIFEDTINMVYLQGIALPAIFYFQLRKKISVDKVMFTTNNFTGNELILVHDAAIQKGW